MNGINELPKPTDAGLNFDYELWDADSEITLCIVPWSNAYDNVVEFESDAALNAYIDSLPDTVSQTLGQMTYLTPGNPIKIDLPHNVAHRYNYVRVRNPKQPAGNDIQRDYYYFILNTTRLAAQTTEINVQIDVWQSYRRMVRFLQAYIDTGHVGIANELQDENNGRKWLNTPEGLDTGTEYLTAWVSNIEPAMRNYDVVVTFATNPVAPPGTVNDPFLHTSSGGRLHNLPTATGSYAVKGSEFGSYMAAMSGYSWVTQGMIRAVLVPNFDTTGMETIPVERSNNYPPGPEGSNQSYLRRIQSSSTNYKRQVDFDPDAMRDRIMNRLPSRYRYLRKFATSPYSFIEVSTGYGDSFTYRPELFGKGVKNAEVALCLIPGSERIEFSVRGYNAVSASQYGDQYATAVSINNLPTLPVVNNMAIAGLASSAHSRNAARQNAAWGNQIATAGANAAMNNTMLGAATGYENESANMRLSENLQGMQQATVRSNAQLGIVGGILGGGANSALGAGTGGATPGGMGAAAMVGAASSAAGSAVSAMQIMNTQQSERDQLQASLSTGRANMNRNYDATIGMAETNWGLAHMAAAGNYEASIRSINATVQDTMLTQPGMSGQYGGEFLRLLQKGFTFEVREKVIDNGAVQRIGEYWLRYGYKVNTFAMLNNNLKVMSKFSYWKLNEVYVSAGRVPEMFKQALRGIMERGTTVWTDPAIIGVTDPGTNIPLTGITIQNGA